MVEKYLEEKLLKLNKFISSLFAQKGYWYKHLLEQVYHKKLMWGISLMKMDYLSVH